MSLRVRGLVRRHGAVAALDGIDLDVADGELVCVVGPSGAGKTTLLRCVAGLDAPDAGTVEVGGRDVTRRSPRDRDVAMVFQDGGLFAHLTLADNVAFGLRARGVGRAEARLRAHAAAELVGVDRLLARRPAQVSGGERQRAALARAIAREPAVFLLDEPLSSLDVELRATLRREIGALQRRLGVTMLHVTHDQDEALALGDRVAVLAGGRLEQVGTPAELYDAPVSPFVARFIGRPGATLLGPGNLLVACAPGETVAVRPEDVVLTRGHTAAGGGPGVAATVEAVEPLGPDRLALLVLDGGVRLTARITRDAAPVGGERVHVAVARSRRFGAAPGADAP